MVASTSSGEIDDGSTYRVVIRHVDSPIVRAASTNSAPRTLRTLDRTSRAIVGHPNRASTSDTVSTDRSPTLFSTTTAPSRNGNPRNTSVSRARTASTHPPTMPATVPTTTATMPASRVVSTATAIDDRVPQTTFAYTSQPCRSKPNGCPAVGDAPLRPRSHTRGSPWPNRPANSCGNAAMSRTTTSTDAGTQNPGVRAAASSGRRRTPTTGSTVAPRASVVIGRLLSGRAGRGRRAAGRRARS